MFYSMGYDVETWEYPKMQNRIGGVSPLLSVRAAFKLCVEGWISFRNEPGPAIP